MHRIGSVVKGFQAVPVLPHLGKPRVKEFFSDVLSHHLVCLQGDGIGRIRHVGAA
jgi:hypothetical protein